MIILLEMITYTFYWKFQQKEPVLLFLEGSLHHITQPFPDKADFVNGNLYLMIDDIASYRIIQSFCLWYYELLYNSGYLNIGLCSLICTFNIWYFKVGIFLIFCSLEISEPNIRYKKFQNFTLLFTQSFLYPYTI